MDSTLELALKEGTVDPAVGLVIALMITPFFSKLDWKIAMKSRSINFSLLFF
jgi:hypothetical protein